MVVATISEFGSRLYEGKRLCATAAVVVRDGGSDAGFRLCFVLQQRQCSAAAVSFPFFNYDSFGFVGLVWIGYGGDCALMMICWKTNFSSRFLDFVLFLLVFEMMVVGW
ncbi:unnamed protein product [Trifolium pratense]|uniref:Uncharacterized protein n=1 Tax=Trifolium pratense TaxID=57577 RepID=A0ACB0K4X8_TRIPR|nr:unnamed protein product [Trifolium pratense]